MWSDFHDLERNAVRIQKYSCPGTRESPCLNESELISTIKELYRKQRLYKKKNKKNNELIEHLISVAGVVALPCTLSACKGTACHSMTQAQRYLPTEWLILHGKYRPLFASAGSNSHPECPKSLLAPFHFSNLSLDEPCRHLPGVGNYRGASWTLS